ncbi:MAG TPA: hypothetical protein DGG94_02145 [Micromonosporaceae bacterium]|nr:hypothetical protein [Micromonosporaceae bacterium]HCU48625.1 hypothetical protein [Micromonosporaceae bacterium]
MKGITSLREAILSVPIPGAPPRLSQDGAAVGLAFLDTAIRQNHVRRLTQRLALIEHRAARCVTEVDVSLSLLDDNQREAGLLYQRLRNRGERPGRDLNAGGGDQQANLGGMIWVPVSKVSRRSLSPIDVVNAEGVKLPRLTQYETSRLMASALYRLLRAILSTHPDARQRSKLNDFLFRVDKPRWLVQAALVTLLAERSKPTVQLHRREPTRNTVAGEGARYRQDALDVLANYEGSLHEYQTLLDIAVNDYLIVVALDPVRDEHLLSFDSPLHVVDTTGSQRGRKRSSEGAYWVKYSTNLPAGLRAYHLVAETEPGIEIERMYLASDADRTIVTSLKADLVVLADRVADERRAPTGHCGQKILELELQTGLRRLSELIRRRRWEASHAEFEIADRELLPATSDLAWATSSGEAVPENGVPRSSLAKHPLVTPESLAQAANEIEETQLFRDLNVENDPARARAHVYWRRDPSRIEVDNSISISTSMFLTDTSGSSPGSIRAYVVSVIAISYLLGCLMFGSLFPFTADGPIQSSLEPDAIIAVLLLVPGFLYTRLNLPARQSIAGQLRKLPRQVAHVSIFSSALLAATIAASNNPIYIRLALAVGVVAPLAALYLMTRLSSKARTELIVDDETLPAWVRSSSAADWRAMPQRRMGRTAIPDAVFRTSGATHGE